MAAGPGASADADEARQRKNSKETIHSGHFMVSDFEAEAEDEEGIEVPDPAVTVESVEEIQGVRGINQGGVITYAKPTNDTSGDGTTVSIDASLTKLFQTMSLAYRQNITSPKWNRFKGVRLRWKDKIRLNNVIWRCWHMQYIQKKNMTICQFALDVDMHNRPEAVVLEGKYWKRRLRAVTAEYKKWRLYYKNSLCGLSPIFDQGDMNFLGLEEMDWACSFFNKQIPSPEEGNLMDSIDFTDMLFSPFLTSPQLFPFPNPREIARSTGNSDLLQPGLIQLQPDLMDYDIIDIHEMLAGRGLPTVPEEDLFPDVEDAAALPPSSSPPSVSTPTPTTHTDFISRHPPLAHTFSNHPSSPQMYSPHESFIPSREHAPQTESSASHISHQHTTSEQEFKFDLRPEVAHRPYARSRSAQDLHSGASDPKTDSRQDSHGPSFAVPKNIPKKKYYLGASSNWTPVTSVATTNSLVAGTNALAFPSTVAPPSQGLSSFSDESSHHPQISHSQTAPSLRISSALEIFTPTTESSIFAHILSSDSYIPPSTQPSPPPPPPPSSPQHLSKIKVARISPRPYHDAASAPSVGKLSSGSSSSSGTGSNPPLLSNVSLSAVTPSSIKSIHPHASSASAQNWSSTSRPLKILKASPPYPEPNSPTSAQTASSPPNKAFRPKNDVERVQYKEHRRVCHINAEQKRRCNIKNNFDMLHSLVPSVSQNPNAKVSKATMLHKGAEYIMQMKQERQQLAEQADQLRNQIETLSTEISLAQSMLPATGVGMRPTRHNKTKEKFDAYVRDRTLANPKYYVIALIAQPLLQSYNSSVSTASVDDLCRSSMAWLDQHCSLNVLRPVVSNAMRKLSVTTNILTTPETLYEDIFRQVTKQEGAKYSPFSSKSEQR